MGNITTSYEITTFIPNVDMIETAQIAPFIDDSEEFIKSQLLGDPLYVYVAGLGAEDSGRKMVANAIFLKAFYEAIPFLDLILTPNGFGVVSNSNQSPASKDRVASLRKQLKTRFWAYYDDIITYITRNSVLRDLWITGEPFRLISQTLFLTGINYSQYAQVVWTDDIRPLDRDRSFILLSEQSLIEPAISADYLQELKVKQYTNMLTPDDIVIMGLVKSAIGLEMSVTSAPTPKKCYEYLSKAINHMEKFIDKYPTYAESQEYTVRHSLAYENQLEDTTYFGAL